MRPRLTTVLLLVGSVAAVPPLLAAQAGGTSAAPRSTRQAAPPAARRAKPVTGVAEETAAIADFNARLKAYVALRTALGNKLHPLSQTSSADELARRQEELAAALGQARTGAKPGDLIPPLIARQIGRAVADDLRRR